MIVKYSKKFPYAPYLNEDIGFEMSIDNYPSDKTQEEKALAALLFLKSIAEKFHKDNNPQPGDSIEKFIVPSYSFDQKTYPSAAVPTIDPKKKDETEIAIDNATTLEDLEKLLVDAAKYNLVSQFNEKKKQLSQ